MKQISSDTIFKMIQAAKALEAPLFGLDKMIEVALAMEDQPPQNWLYADPKSTKELAQDQETLTLGAEAAFAFAANLFLPDALAKIRNDQEANSQIIAATKLRKKYCEKWGPS